MSLKGKFLCGCTPSDKINYSTDFDQQGRTVERRDSEGHLVCPEHGERLYGWRSPMVTGPQGNEIYDYGKLGTHRLPLIASTVIDQRDMRAPEQVFAEMKAGVNGHA